MSTTDEANNPGVRRPFMANAELRELARSIQRSFAHFRVIGRHEEIPTAGLSSEACIKHGADEADLSEIAFETVLLSFEGTPSRLDTHSGRRFAARRSRSRPSSRRHLRIFENCIVKNFHVSNMRAVRAHISVCVRMQFQRTVRFIRPKPNETRINKVKKSAQVDTLASQAMKDVASCDKLGGAANER